MRLTFNRAEQKYVIAVEQLQQKQLNARFYRKGR
jgi:hypothetical protein